MIKYVYKTAKRSKMFVTSVMLLSLLFTAVPASLGALVTTKETTTESIEKFGRGSYDLLVRPEEGRTEIEKVKGVVEENYLTGGNGGISLEQYQTIKGIEEVEIAAPVAVLGFFTNDSGGMSLNIPRPTNQQSTLTTVDFYNDTGLSDEYNTKYRMHILAFPTEDLPAVGSRQFDLTYNETGYQIAFSMPQQYNLLVSVDPKQEDLLTKQNGEISSKLPDKLNNIRPKNGLKPVSGTTLPEIPLLINKDVKTATLARIQVRETHATSTELKSRLHEIKSFDRLETILTDELAHEPFQAYELDLTKFSKPFHKPYLMVTNEGKVGEGPGGLSTAINTSTYYLTNRIEYRPSDNTKSDFVLVPQVVDGGQSYRGLIRKGLTPEQGAKSFALFSPRVVGEFSGQNIANDQLDPSPLGIYSFSPSILISDKDGNPSNTVLQKDFTPDTFLPLQASALTNLEAATILKGEEPIDAIRVRVSGIDRYDAAAEQKIIETAAKIEEKTGLSVDIVAGASKQNINVEVPAITNLPAVGVVQEVWTTLGVATQITDAVNKVAILTALGIAMLVVLYTICHTQALFILRQREFSVLLAIGWSRKDIEKLIMTEWAIKGALSAAISVLAIVFLKPYLGLGNYWPLVIGVQVVIVVCLLLSVRMTTRRIHDESMNLSKHSEWDLKSSRLKSIFSVSKSNLFGQIRFNIWSVLLVSLAGTVVLFNLNMIVAEQENVAQTFLGVQVNSASSEMQWLVVGAALAILIFGFVDSIMTQIGKRKQEIYILRILGWKLSHIVRLLIGELAMLTGTGFLMAMFLGLGLYRVMYDEFALSLLHQVGYSIGLFGALVSLAVILIRNSSVKV